MGSIVKKLIINGFYIHYFNIFKDFLNATYAETTAYKPAKEYLNSDAQ